MCTFCNKIVNHLVNLYSINFDLEQFQVHQLAVNTFGQQGEVLPPSCQINKLQSSGF